MTLRYNERVSGPGYYRQVDVGTTRILIGPFATREDGIRAWMFCLSMDDFSSAVEQQQRNRGSWQILAKVYFYDENELLDMVQEPSAHGIRSVQFKPVSVLQVHSSWKKSSTPFDWWWKYYNEGKTS